MNSKVSKIDIAIATTVPVLTLCVLAPVVGLVIFGLLFISLPPYFVIWLMRTVKQKPQNIDELVTVAKPTEQSPQQAQTMNPKKHRKLFVIWGIVHISIFVIIGLIAVTGRILSGEGRDILGVFMMMLLLGVPLLISYGLLPAITHFILRGFSANQYPAVSLSLYYLLVSMMTGYVVYIASTENGEAIITLLFLPLPSAIYYIWSLSISRILYKKTSLNNNPAL